MHIGIIQANVLENPISLNDHPLGIIHFDVGSSLDLVVDNAGLVLYESSVEHTRQIKALSKVFDFAALGLANTNVQQSLLFLENRDQIMELDNFMLSGRFEYHISRVTMAYTECPIYCAAKSSEMIDTASGFYHMLKVHAFNSVWVKTRTFVDASQSSRSYEVRLGSDMIYPTNVLSVRDTPQVFIYHQEGKFAIDNIQDLYAYYDTQSSTYWTQHPYDLHASIDRTVSVSIYVPENPLHLLNKQYHEQCACYRLPSQSNIMFNDMISAFHHQQFQMVKMGLGIEQERLDTENPLVGTLPALVYPFLAPETRKTHTTPNFVFKSVQDLNPLIPPQRSEDLLASTIFYGVSKIGPPLVLAMLKPTLADLANRMEAKLYDKINPKEGVHEFIKVSGLGLQYTNFSLVLEYNNMPAFSRNISSDVVVTQTLLRNLTHTNEVFANFLTNEVEQILLNMAKSQIVDKIDTSVPILGKISRRKSFLLIDFYFSVYTDSTSVTTYQAVSIPLYSSENKLWNLDVPNNFSTQPSHAGFLFPEDISDQWMYQCYS